MPGQGLQFLPLQRIPSQWDPVWFAAFVRDVLALADIRNAIEGPGISISGQPGQEATVSASTDLTALLATTFVTVTPSGLSLERVLTGEGGVVTITDGGANGPVTVSLTVHGVPLSKLVQPPGPSILGNKFASASEVALITPSSADLVLTYDGTTIDWRQVKKAQIETTTLDAGTYTPTLTSVANVAASTPYLCQWLRIANVVHVSGRVDVDPTAAASTQLGISLPVPSNIGAPEDVAGVAACNAVAGQSAAILGDATNDRAQLEWIAVDLANRPMYFAFSYKVLP